VLAPSGVPRFRILSASPGTPGAPAREWKAEVAEVGVGVEEAPFQRGAEQQPGEAPSQTA
jgi:hypothetical protein